MTAIESLIKGKPSALKDSQDTHALTDWNDSRHANQSKQLI